MGIVENTASETKPLNGYLTQPANESVEKRVQESLQYLKQNAQPEQNDIAKQNLATETVKHEENKQPAVEQSSVAQNEPASEVKNFAEMHRTFVFSGRIGTISAVTHIRAEMTQACASDEVSQPYPIVQWQESRYYFHGRGSAGHHSAISHVYSEPMRAEAK